jgi:DNA mismatch endonuclease, patch repair protein
MTDVLTPEQRRLNMSRVKGKNTKPEITIRRGLHARGLRYRLHTPTVPGRPDLVFPRYRVAIFTHGCFWHGHDCPLFTWPATRVEFWRIKIVGNRDRDARTLVELKKAGWRVLVIWECALHGPNSLRHSEVMDRAERFILQSVEPVVEINAHLDKTFA